MVSWQQHWFHKYLTLTLSPWCVRYGLIWISTTLVFVLASFGNCATYLMEKRTDNTTSWSFDVSYMNVAAGSVYGYAIVVPLAFYFLLHYLGSKPSLVQFWCLWGYSFFVFVLASVSCCALCFAPPQPPLSLSSLYRFLRVHISELHTFPSGVFKPQLLHWTSIASV